MLPSATPLGALENPAEFIARHIGIDAADEVHMLSVVGARSLRELIDGIVPPSIARSSPMANDWQRAILRVSTAPQWASWCA